MVKIVEINGIKIKANTLVQAPKKRITLLPNSAVGFLPCYCKEVCQVTHCSKYDIVDNETKTILRLQCEEDCKKRVNLDNVPIEVCKECSYIKVQKGIPLHHVPPAVNCIQYIKEARKSVGRRLPPSKPDRIFRRGGIGDNWYGGHKV